MPPDKSEAQSGPSPPRSWRLLSLCAWLTCGAAACAIAVAALWRDDLGPAAGRHLALHYLAFFAATFRYHAGLALLPVAVFAMATRRRRLLLVAMVAATVGAGPEVLLIRPRSGEGGPPAPPGLTIMSVNLMYGRTSVPSLMREINAADPDVIVFQEWTPGASSALVGRLTGKWPHMVEQSRDDAFGQAVFSRIAFAEPPRLYPSVGSWTEPQITVAVPVAERTMRITNVHVLPPISLDYFVVQRSMSRSLAEWAAAETGPHVLIGDFNAVRGSGVLRAFTGAGFRDAHEAVGDWRGSTWPRIGWLRWAPGIQLDHALIGRGAAPLKARTLPDVGSDHRPVVVRVGWSAP